MAIINGDNIANVLDGTRNADTIYGFDGIDIINGDRGNDSIYGGAGNDVLEGGAGNDLFYWTLGDGNDVISDQRGTETLHIMGVSAADSLSFNLDLSGNFYTITI